MAKTAPVSAEITAPFWGIVSGADPLFVTVMVAEFALPTAVLGKVIDVGDTDTDDVAT